MDVSSRYGELDSVFLRRASQPADKDAFYSVETLLDSLMVLYQECCSSSMRRERTISEFVESGNQLCVHVKHLVNLRYTFQRITHTQCLYTYCNNVYTYDMYTWISRMFTIVKPLISRLTKMRLRADDFETLNIIGRGAFGEVGSPCINFGT